MAVPKKRTSISKKKIRKNFWKKGGYWTALKAHSLAECIFTDKSKSFFYTDKRNKSKGFFCNITDKPKGFFVTKKNVELE